MKIQKLISSYWFLLLLGLAHSSKISVTNSDGLETLSMSIQSLKNVKNAIVKMERSDTFHLVLDSNIEGLELPFPYENILISAIPKTKKPHLTFKYNRNIPGFSIPGNCRLSGICNLIIFYKDQKGEKICELIFPIENENDKEIIIEENVANRKEDFSRIWIGIFSAAILLTFFLFLYILVFILHIEVKMLKRQKDILIIIWISSMVGIQVMNMIGILEAFTSFMLHLSILGIFLIWRIAYKQLILDVNEKQA